MHLTDYYLGLDGGGSGCRALLADAHGNIIGTGQAGAANIGAAPEAALENILLATIAAFNTAGLDNNAMKNCSAVLGLAGANSHPDLHTLYISLPFKSSHIVSDAVTTLAGAIGSGDGLVVILGTGSTFIRRFSGLVQTIGGRGFMLSDHAGGARLGRELLEETLLAHDGMAEITPVARQVLQQFDNDVQNIIQFSRTASAADYARFAPLLFDTHSDLLSQTILKRACTAISKGLEAFDIEKLGCFSVTGGLAESYAALPYFPYRDLYKRALGSSLDGALALALKHKWVE